VPRRANCRVKVTKEEVARSPIFGNTGKIIRLAMALGYKVGMPILNHILGAMLAAVRVRAAKT
jgi:hypothetical protein